LLGTPTGTTQLATGLLAATNYIWHVKTDCSNNSQDVTFTTSSNTSTFCPSPAQLNNSNITQSSATLSWTPVSGATSYSLEYKPSGTSTWITVSSINTNSLTLSNLTAGTAYDWWVKANCSVYSALAAFTTTSTQNTGNACNAPGNLTTTNVTSTSATFSWSAVTGAQSYSVKYKKGNGKNWTVVNNITTTSHTLTNLTKSSAYQWMVSSKCAGNTTSAYTNAVSFSTPSHFMIGEEEMRVYPNPADEILSIDMNSWDPEQTGTGYIFNVQGAKIEAFKITSGHNTISLDGISSGLYLLYIQSEGREALTQKFIKE
jgi:hypothetical protein